MASISYKCPNCDGELLFDPASQQYKCEYCISYFTQQQLDDMAQEQAQDESGQNERKEDEAVVYHCPSCGAQIVTDSTTAATFCYYCHNPVVLGGRLEGRYLPDLVIPFEITREKAVEGFLAYIKKKKFVPRSFWNRDQIERISGVYFPYWLYDVTYDGNIQGEAKNIRTWRSGNVQYTETKQYRILRDGQITLKNLSVNALKKANAVLAQGILPYRFETMKPFRMGYLSGFLAERRDVEREEMQADVRSTMKQHAKTLMTDTIAGYSSVSVHHAAFRETDEKFKYALFPVWTITYKAAENNVYFYSMNAQTGKVCGKLPIHYGKVLLVSVLSALAVFAIGLAGGYYLW